MKKEIVLPIGTGFSVRTSDYKMIITYDESANTSQYKDGDFLMSPSGCFIHESKPNGWFGAYCGVNSMDRIQVLSIDLPEIYAKQGGWTKTCCGYASDEQREEFLIRLCTERGYIWDAANHKLVKYIKSKR